MDQGPYLIDTNVFVIDLRFPRDSELRRQPPLP